MNFNENINQKTTWKFNLCTKCKLPIAMDMKSN